MTRSILATFPSTTQARKAVEALKEAGYRHVQIDRVSEYPSPPSQPANPEFNNPVAGLATSNTGLSLYSSDHLMDDDARPLVAADPAVSGMAGTHEIVGGRNVLVTVVCPEGKVDEAVRIIKERGGWV